MRRPLFLLLLASLTASPALAAERALITARPEGATLNAAPDAAANLKSLRQQAASAGTAKVIVELRVPFAPEGTLSTPERAAQRRDIASAAAALRNSFADVAKRRAGALRTYSSVPFAAMEVTPQELSRLAADPRVISISEDKKNYASLAESGALVRAPVAWAAGYTGAGQTVAILDTGVDRNHPFLAGKVVSEACYSRTFCAGGAPSSTAPGSGMPCTGSDDCAHGTHVAGIAAGRGESASGIAKDASIIAIQVFSRDDTDPTRATAWDSDILAGANRVFELRSSYSIAAVNLSLGSGRYKRSCDSISKAAVAIIANLKSAGIATVAASGNEGWTDSISAPACFSNAVSVGAVSDGDWGPCDGLPTAADKVTCYSNMAPFMSLLAPGSLIVSSVPGGGYAGYHGTSMAAPHVAGAWAVIRQKFPDAPVPEVLAALQASGKPVADDRTTRRPVTKPRIDVAAALDRLARFSFTKTGTGSGNVRIVTPSTTLNCTSDCAQSLATGRVVKLTAKADRGSRFIGWSGACSGARATCTVTLSATQSVTASFVLR